jgi:hypothetical protein
MEFRFIVLYCREIVLKKEFQLSSDLKRYKDFSGNCTLSGFEIMPTRFFLFVLAF